MRVNERVGEWDEAIRLTDFDFEHIFFAVEDVSWSWRFIRSFLDKHILIFGNILKSGDIETSWKFFELYLIIKIIRQKFIFRHWKTDGLWFFYNQKDLRFYRFYLHQIHPHDVNLE